MALSEGVCWRKRAYLVKAAESLASAEADCAAARYNSCANRVYYACFQAAVAALLSVGIQPANPRGEWSHEFVQSQFNGLLINRRKLYQISLRRVLRDTMEVREKADYTLSSVSERVAKRVLRQAQEFVQTIQEQMS
ncbi:MAG: HEPN domain-containing protein [Candidatus Binatia bacterium]